MEIKIPDLGDIDEVEVIELCVDVGDTVAVDEGLIVIESDKASMEVPSSAAGVVKEIKVALGDLVGSGHVIVILDADEGSDKDADDDKQKDEKKDENKDEKKDRKKNADETAQREKTEEEEKDSGAEAEEEQEQKQEKQKALDSDEKAATDKPSDGQSDSAGKGDAQASEKVEVLVPDIGDAKDVVVIEIAVSEGDEVAVDDLLVVLESDKASMEIAAEQAGRVIAVAVTEGQEVAQGTHIVTLEVAASTGKQTSESPETSDESDDDSGKDPDAQTKSAEASEQSAEAQAKVADAPSSEQSDASEKASASVYAGPAVRRLARELGVDLTRVKGSGKRGRLVKDDVKAFVKERLSGGEAAAGGTGLPSVPQIDFAKFGTVEVVDLTRIQQRGAKNLHASWVNLPHVTQHDEADVTDLEDFRRSLKAEAEQKGVKVTPLAFLIKACCHALVEFPRFNSSLHPDHKRLVLKSYINIGMAVDTPEGLVVPVIRDADKKSIWTLSKEVIELSDKARNKKLSMDDLQGGTFSISSLGALGGTGFTPIVNAPEVAILGVSNLQTRPRWDGEGFVPRKMLPLSLSYDHRVINGADGGRFMVYLTTVLGDIRRLAL